MLKPDSQMLTAPAPCKLSIDCNSKTLTIAVINCQSVFAKRTSLWNFIEHEHPNVMIGNESWLNPNIYFSEVLLSEQI